MGQRVGVGGFECQNPSVGASPHNSTKAAHSTRVSSHTTVATISLPMASGKS